MLHRIIRNKKLFTNFKRHNSSTSNNNNGDGNDWSMWLLGFTTGWCLGMCSCPSRFRHHRS